MKAVWETVCEALLAIRCSEQIIYTTWKELPALEILQAMWPFSAAGLEYHVLVIAIPFLLRVPVMLGDLIGANKDLGLKVIRESAVGLLLLLVVLKVNVRNLECCVIKSLGTV